MPKLIIIAAMGENHVIGHGEGMPWDVPEEYAQFLKQVDGQSLIMGRRSFEIFGADLTHTRLIVVSRRFQSFPTAVAAATFSAAVQIASKYPETIFIGGGASIYEQSLPIADRMHLSIIHGKFPGDTFFPDFDRAKWRVEVHTKAPDYDYFEYSRP